MPEPTPSLEEIGSEAVRRVIQASTAEGNTVEEVAQWSRALVAHMREGLSPALRAWVAEQYPELRYFKEDGTPHNAAAEGYVDDGFAVSFPRSG